MGCSGRVLAAISLCRDKIHELLNGSIGLVIGHFNLGWRLIGLRGSMLKQRVGQRAADALVEEDEHRRHPLSLSRESIPVTWAIALQ